MTRGRKKFKVVEESSGYGKKEMLEGDSVAELARKLAAKAGMRVEEDDE